MKTREEFGNNQPTGGFRGGDKKSNGVQKGMKNVSDGRRKKLDKPKREELNRGNRARTQRGKRSRKDEVATLW